MGGLNYANCHDKVMSQVLCEIPQEKEVEPTMHLKLQGRIPINNQILTIRTTIFISVNHSMSFLFSLRSSLHPFAPSACFCATKQCPLSSLLCHTTQSICNICLFPFGGPLSSTHVLLRSHCHLFSLSTSLPAIACFANQASMHCGDRDNINVVHSFQDIYSCDVTFLLVQLFASLYLNVLVLLVINVQKSWLVDP